MPFFMVDDQLQTNAKAQSLIRTAMRGDMYGPAALGLWTMAGSLCQAKLTDGVVSLEDLISLLLDGGTAQQLADRLVTAGLWHGEHHECDRCPEVEPGTYLFHDWFALSYARSDTVKVKRDKSKELKSPELIAKVWWRDCTDEDQNNPTRGRCRYCSREVLRSDRKSDTRPTLDHVDPRKAVGHQNVVLACFDCNRKKAARTPEQAGMKLLPAPPRRSSSTPSSTPPRSSDAGTEPHTSTPTGAENAGSISPRTDAAGTEDWSEDSIKQPDQTDIRQISEPISEPKRVLGRAHEGARAGRAGVGVGLGTSTGLPAQTPATPKPRARKRNRPRRRSTGTSDQHEDPHQAGDAPDVPAVGLHGSPWHGWRGQRSKVEETTCDLHQQEQPCRHCIQESE